MRSNAISVNIVWTSHAFLAQPLKARGGNWKKLFEDFPQNWKIPPVTLCNVFWGISLLSE